MGGAVMTRAIRLFLLFEALKKVSVGAGILAGVAGRHYEEYLRVHGE
jgi:hypothetical protein